MAKKEKAQEPTEALMIVVAFFGVVTLLMFGSILLNFLQGNEQELHQGKVTKFGTIPGSVIPWILFAGVFGSCCWIYECIKKIGKIRDKKNKRKTKS